MLGYRPYALGKLRAGQVLDLDGVLVKMDEGEIRAGDMYVAERNTGLKFLTALWVDEGGGCIFPTTDDYAFDIEECVKVCEA